MTKERSLPHIRVTCVIKFRTKKGFFEGEKPNVVSCTLKVKSTVYIRQILRGFKGFLHTFFAKIWVFVSLGMYRTYLRYMAKWNCVGWIGHCVRTVQVHLNNTGSCRGEFEYWNGIEESIYLCTIKLKHFYTSLGKAGWQLQNHFTSELALLFHFNKY